MDSTLQPPNGVDQPNAMVVVLFDRRAVGGRGLPLAVKAFVLFGAALLLGIAVVIYVKLASG